MAMGQDGQQQAERDALMARFTRPEQTFPTLTPAEIERVRHFGEVRNYADGSVRITVGNRQSTRAVLAAVAPIAVR